ncbi:MAG: endonuclease/exonuclease/phosphatase family protein [Bacteroidales bacterium]|nr:endonuclease/exonuclease/phosphatase family protein [Bacteroidales bacterium]
MKIKYFLAAATLLLVLGFAITSCKNNLPDNFTVVFYNVENLFDTKNDEGIRDGDFTPEGAIVWDEQKYTKKLHDIARVLSAIDSVNLPVLIGLAEVENLGVLVDLTSQTKLKAGNYEIVHFDSPDERGIDVALLFRREFFTPLHARPYPLTFDFDRDDHTRDMLYVKGIAGNHDTLHLMINHWPSRSGGKEKSDPKRQAAAYSARQVVDSILKFNPFANIIIMGDLNDNPTDDNVILALDAKRINDEVKTVEIYNLAINKFEHGEGTLYYKSWDLFDQIIVSGNILNGNTQYKLNSKDIQILKEEWMLFTNRSGVKVPNRMAGRSEYYGGFSDHLPVYIQFSK